MDSVATDPPVATVMVSLFQRNLFGMQSHPVALVPPRADRRGGLYGSCLLMAKRTVKPDAGLQQIDDFERAIVLAREQTWRFNGVSENEIARLLPDLEQLAKNVTDQLRAEYRTRMSQP